MTPLSTEQREGQKSPFFRMPRRKKWSPLSGKPEATEVATVPDVFERDLREYLHFCSHNEMEPGPEGLLQYGRSQRAAGLDGASVANRLDQFKGVTATNALNILAHHRVKRFSAELRQAKARAGGPKRKPLVAISALSRWFDPSHIKTDRDRVYATLWFVLCATGMRPEEHHHMDCRIGNDGESLEICFRGRKSNSSTGAPYVRFPFQLSCEPPSYVRDRLLKGRLDTIGTPKNCASCINSWLKSHQKGNFPEPTEPSVTSTVPRVRMDNVLRDLIDEGEYSANQFEVMMGHTIKTSDSSYRR